MNLQQDMEREQMRVAILKQEQTFRQQVHELHRLYHVQKQLMMQQQAQATASNRAPAVTAVVDVKPRSQLDVWHLVGEKTTNPPHQLISFTGCNNARTPAPALSEECNLELTLATGGPSSTSSNSCCDDAGGRQGKRLKASSNSESGATAVSSTSTESELAQFGDMDVTTAVRFRGESRGMGMGMGMRQGAWMYHQCQSLKTA